MWPIFSNPFKKTKHPKLTGGISHVEARCMTQPKKETVNSIFLNGLQCTYTFVSITLVVKPKHTNVDGGFLKMHNNVAYHVQHYLAQHSRAPRGTAVHSDAADPSRAKSGFTGGLLLLLLQSSHAFTWTDLIKAYERRSHKPQT